MKTKREYKKLKSIKKTSLPPDNPVREIKLNDMEQHVISLI